MTDVSFNFGPQGSVGEAIRTAMLYTDISLAFDEILCQPPATRCVTIFQSLNVAAAEDDDLKAHLMQAGVFAALHGEAKRRQPLGMAGMPPVLEPVAARERGGSHAQ